MFSKSPLEVSELGLVWSMPLSFKGHDRESPKRGRGKCIIGWGLQTCFGGGVLRYVPPPNFSPRFAAPCQRDIPAWRLSKSNLAGRFSQQISTPLENSSPILRQRDMLSLPKFGHFPARKMAAGRPRLRERSWISPPRPPQPS